MDTEEPFGDPARRRWWLLIKALECLPLDRALDLARAADSFVLAAGCEGANPGLSTSAPMAEFPGQQGAPPSGRPAETGGLVAVARQKSRLPISPGRHDELRQRLAAGATNAELAAEFGLTARQVQGVRMGVRRTTRGRDGAEIGRLQDQHPPVSSSVEEVIRYLRQQDDVVVSEGQGNFIVNGRFHLAVPALVERANRMRCRQNKPLFKFDEVAPPAPQQNIGPGVQ